MSLSASAAVGSSPPLDDPATRGLTRVAPQVVERIAAYACERVPGTVTPRSTPHGVKAPAVRARADVNGSRAHLSITLGMPYAAPVATTALDVRRAVEEDVERLGGMRVVAVDVEAVPIRTTRRSRVQ